MTNLFIVIINCLCLFPLAAQAYQIEPAEIEAGGVFILSPAKIEVNLAPGEEITKDLTITNQTGHTVHLKISKEDFEGSQDPQKATIFLGEVAGRFSLKDWLKSDIEEFDLKDKEKITIKVTITVPEDAQPAGYYGVIFAASQPRPEEPGQAKTISRLGSLFFVKVKGQVNEQGFLKEFKTAKDYFQKPPIEFELFFQNDGNVHLISYGLIEIKNILGKRVGEIHLDPWFIMPDSLRLRKITWSQESLFGLYKATAKINRGYQNIIDQKSIWFLVIPWQILLAGLVGLSLIIFILWKKKSA